jgi:nitrite reductase/ring-hydroxylating ferredoxin subunit
MATAATLFGTSLAARVGGNRVKGRLLGLLGISAVGAGGYLGGHLTYAEGVGVDPATFEELPSEWIPVLADAALGEGELKGAEAEGVAICVARVNGELHALWDTCVHRGGSLSEGELDGACVVCPLHSSAFRLEDGSVERGPATYPQPVLEARVQDGSIEVRATP